MINRTSPGSYALVTKTTNSRNSTPKFKAFLFSFAAQFKSFLRGCRSIIGFDGTHISGLYKGILFVVSINGDNEIFPVAYGIVETESKES